MLPEKLVQLPENPEAIIQKKIEKLANLSVLEYEMTRESMAKELKFRASALDGMVSKLRQIQTENDDNNVITEDKPHNKKVNLETVLFEIENLIRKYVILPNEAITAVALWAASTYIFDAFRVFPKLGIISPEKRCGKTTLLDLISCITNRSLMASNISASAIFRSVDLWKPTLLIDEADTFLAGRNDDLIGIINSGHTRSSAFVVRVTGDDHIPKKFSTWSPMVFSSIKGLAGTVMDRSIIISLRRRTIHESVQRMPVDLKSQNAHIRQKLIRWSRDNFQTLKANQVEPPEIANDRAADNWLVLLTVANNAGLKWKEKAENSYQIINAIQEPETAAIMLLRDIQHIFEERNRTTIFSSELVYDLIRLEERPWSEWKRGEPMSQNSLAKILSTFSIKSKDIRQTNVVKKGYELEVFKDAFHRYIPKTDN